jgi:UTP--glucose-1-phosphate uridylyltransferase
MPILPVRKAIIPAAGKGTRLAPLTPHIPKELLPVGGKPMLQRVLEEAAAAGLTEVAIVISRGKELLRAYFSDEYPSGVPENAFLSYLHDVLGRLELTFIEQPEQRGLGDAISCCREFIAGEPFALMLPDNLFLSRRPAIGKLLAVYADHGAPVIGCKSLFLPGPDGIPVNEAPFGYRMIDEQVLELTHIYQKGDPPPPVRQQPRGDVRGIGRALFTPDFLEAIEALRGKVSGELDDIRPLAHMAGTRRIMGYLLPPPHFDVGDFPGFINAQRRFIPIDTENQYYVPGGEGQ